MADLEFDFESAIIDIVRRRPALAGKIADYIAGYMKKKQSREPGGGFFRIGPKGFTDATMLPECHGGGETAGASFP